MKRNENYDTIVVTKCYRSHKKASYEEFHRQKIMNDKQLKLFLSIADQGSFSKAGEVEYLSKQAMLRQINTLEDEVGVKLFSRMQNGISLTPAGKEFYQGARKMLKLRDNVLAKCRNVSRTQETIRVGQVEHQALLNDVTDAFAVKYPDIRIQKVIHPNHSGEYRVEHDIIDVGETFYSEYTAAAPTAYTRLADMPYVAAISHQHPLAGKKALTLTDLIHYPTIVFTQMIKKEYLQEILTVFSDRTENLLLRKDVDNQVPLAFACSATDTIFLTANCFVRSVPELLTIPLSNGWFQEYGIIYRKNPTPTVRKYIDLAVTIFSDSKN